ncbi:MAG: hypothetical protein HQM08_03770 [Candidatus Riflebacteria bacterium]|nr:hypothetical protein [Candidatus Riflebacteria bacterium]
MISPLKKSSGFTLMEIVMAAGVMAMLLTGMMLVFRTGSKSMQVGNWRIDAQKSTQALLGNLRDLLERANYLNRVLSTGEIASDPLPIQINKRWRDKPASCDGVNETVLCFSVTTPYTAAFPELGRPTPTMGSWAGVVLRCGKFSTSDPNKNNQLTLIKTGTANDFSLWGGKIPSSGYTGFFNADTKNVSLVVNDVATMSIIATIPVDITEAETIEITLILQRVEGGKKTPTTFSEKILANISNRSLAIEDYTP